MAPRAASLVIVPQAVTRSDLLKDYPAAARDGYDAILDIVITESGYRATAFTDFTPTVQGEIRLVDAKTARRISADPKTALQGLRDALEASAKRVVTLMA